MKRFLFALAMSLPATASAAAPQSLAVGEPPKAWPVWAIDAGLRGSFVRDASFDPYSQNDVLTQGSLGASRTLWANDRFSLAPGLRWDFGYSSASARGASTQLLAHRFTLPVEGRVHLQDWLYVLGRIAPGGLYQRTRVTDASLDEGMAHGGWVFAGDLSAGASVRVFGSAPGFWLTPELGYAFSVRGASGVSPEVDTNDPRQFGQLDLRGVSLSGWFFRVGATATF